jgi:hypothetical protein
MQEKMQEKVTEVHHLERQQLQEVEKVQMMVEKVQMMEEKVQMMEEKVQTMEEKVQMQMQEKQEKMEEKVEKVMTEGLYHQELQQLQVMVMDLHPPKDQFSYTSLLSDQSS